MLVHPRHIQTDHSDTSQASDGLDSSHHPPSSSSLSESPPDGHSLDAVDASAKYLRVCWHHLTGTTRACFVPMRRALDANPRLGLSVPRAALGLTQTDQLIPGSCASGEYDLCPILASGLDGFTTGEQLTWKDCTVDPASLSGDERIRLGITEKLPARLRDALEALRRDQRLCSLLGQELVSRYGATKEAEMALLGSMDASAQWQWIVEIY
ncbi:developmental protein FluG [Ophiocordyceps sinensis CO18]|uniref:Developmental protein FluG n=1 Tax=Ophiocordyceps sinensis (strain Co18 / CGMCC 3.14243) TaxID=911162 RepID=T5ACY0_OPHSC|nr:developmental protein FluG [Ophiocordyceps sinensis CO18]